MQLKPTLLGNLARPATLEEGEIYWLKLPAKKRGKFNYQPVRFVRYTACPAVVVIAYKTGKSSRIARDDIFA